MKTKVLVVKPNLSNILAVLYIQPDSEVIEYHLHCHNQFLEDGIIASISYEDESIRLWTSLLSKLLEQEYGKQELLSGLRELAFD